MAQMTWEEIAEQLIRDLQKGKYTSGEKLPSENKLAGELQVSRAEVRKAYSRLKELGYVYSLQGYGSFFAGKKEKIPLAMVGSTSFTQKMEELGIPHESRNIQAKRISYRQPIYESLGLSKDEPVWKVALLRIVDGAPAAVYTRYLPEKYFPRNPAHRRWGRVSRRWGDPVTSGTGAAFHLCPGSTDTPVPPAPRCQ